MNEYESIAMELDQLSDSLNLAYLSELADRVRALDESGCTCGYGGFHEPANKRCALNEEG